MYILQINSYFSVWTQGDFTNAGVLAVIKVVNKPRLYFRYMSDRDVVITDIFRPELEASYNFELVSPEEYYRVKFVDCSSANSCCETENK